MAGFDGVDNVLWQQNMLDAEGNPRANFAQFDNRPNPAQQIADRNAFLIEKEKIVRADTTAIQRGTPEERLRMAEASRRRARFEKSGLRTAQRAALGVTESLGEFAGVATRPQPPPFSREQGVLNDLFGGGDKIWGLGPESSTQVTINNDLNPRQRGDFRTAQMFGF